jgi:hypothetical protein
MTKKKEEKNEKVIKRRLGELYLDSGNQGWACRMLMCIWLLEFLQRLITCFCNQSLQDTQPNVITKDQKR